LLREPAWSGKHERQSISNACTTAPCSTFGARKDMEDVRDGSIVAVDRVQLALVECSQLLVMWSANCIPTCLRGWDESSAHRLTTVSFRVQNCRPSLTAVGGLMDCAPTRTTCSTARRVNRCQRHQACAGPPHLDRLGAPTMAVSCVFPTMGWASQRPPWCRRHESHIGHALDSRQGTGAGGQFDVRSTSREPRSRSRYHCGHFWPQARQQPVSRTSGSLSHVCSGWPVSWCDAMGFLVIGTLTLTPAAAARPALSVPAQATAHRRRLYAVPAISDVDRELDSVAKTGASWLRLLLTGAGSSLSRVNTTGNTSTSR